MFFFVLLIWFTFSCLNTILRTQKPPVFCSRTCRLDTIAKKGADYVKELALANVIDMKTMIQWNEDNKIRFLRLSSEMFPFASHEKTGYDISFASKELAEAGELARKYKHRLTTHPGQFNQLVSPNPKVVSNTIRDLSYHARMLDLMGMDQDSVMIIHMGGVYGDRESAIARFENEFVKLPEPVKRRIVLENDEFGYSVSDLLPVSKKLKIPIVLDWHHHHINPGEVTDLISLLPEINQVWYDRGIRPKQHYSESRNGAKTATEMRAHSDRVHFLPPTSDDVDLMIEAKDKEQAVFQLYKSYNLEHVDDDVWIPKTGLGSLKTGGRKTHKAVAKSKSKLEQVPMEDTTMEIKEEEVKKTPRKSRRISSISIAELKRKEAEVEAIQLAWEEEQELLEKEKESKLKVKKAEGVTKKTKKRTLTEGDSKPKDKLKKKTKKSTTEQ
ncbi:UV-endonuclease UvdE-domain-containing protein [Blakeslea trispora]|nr:UV-endonuclease UvdE-domain-containing protein [Blakeslea trispora]